jgi:hypothetical protein
MHTVRAEIMILPRFAVRNDRRACGFKPFNGVSNRIFEARVEARILAVALCDSFDEINGPWDTADWLGGYRDWHRLGHTCCLARSIIDLTVFGSIGISGYSSRRDERERLSDSSSSRNFGKLAAQVKPYQMKTVLPRSMPMVCSSMGRLFRKPLIHKLLTGSRRRTIP